MSVIINYYPVIVLGSNQVSSHGAAFDCDQCADSFVCCRDVLPNNLEDGCRRCGCQGKDTGTLGCYQNELCGSCDGWDQNAVIFDTSSVMVAPATCAEAQQYIADPSIIGQIININEINIQCNADSRLRCCQGDQTLGPGLCGQYWGPTNNQGACDVILSDYCSVSPDDKACACFTSDLPQPECTDQRCTLPATYKTSFMLNNQCSGNYLTCQQFFELSPDASNNFIQKNTIEQTCGENKGPPSVLSQGLMYLFIIIAIVIFVVAALVFYNLFSKRNVNKKV